MYKGIFSLYAWDTKFNPALGLYTLSFENADITSHRREAVINHFGSFDPLTDYNYALCFNNCLVCYEKL